MVVMEAHTTSPFTDFRDGQQSASGSSGRMPGSRSIDVQLRVAFSNGHRFDDMLVSSRQSMTIDDIGRLQS